jgi:protein SCO1/2
MIFQVIRKNSIGVTIVTVILFFDVLVYKYQAVSCSNATLPRCYPTGEIFPFKDSNGNIKYDSVYHTISNFKLIDQNADVITNDSLKGKIYVANFFFCTCTSICPRMTNYLLLLQNEFKNDGRIIFLSHTVDPENDSVPALKAYEQQNNIDGRQWHLLTGSRKELYDLSRNSYFLGVESDSPENFEHSEQFVLVDTRRIIRGYYNGTDSLEVEKLKGDIKILLSSSEK